MNNDMREVTKYGGKQFYVYTHAAPDGSVFYVGKGVGDRARDFAQRTAKHKSEVASHGRKNVVIRVYPTHDEAHAYAVERQLILAMKKAGLKLCNQDDGGNGRIGVQIGMEQRLRISAALMGHPVSEETRARQRAQRLGTTLSDATRAKLAAKDLSLQLEAMRLANTGLVRSPETKAKISAANKGRKLSPEQCARNGERKRGISPTPETLAKQSAGLKAMWAKRKQAAEGQS